MTPRQSPMKPADRWLATLVAPTFCALAAPAHATLPAAGRAVLDKLYNQTNGAAWTNNSNWDAGNPASDPCDSTARWHDITCDTADDHVPKIEMTVNNLDGTLPSISALTNLMGFQVPSTSSPAPSLPTAR